MIIVEKIKYFKEKYFNNFNQYKKLEKEYKQLKNEELSDEQYDFYLAQRDEIDELHLDDFDEEEFIKERNELNNFEKMPSIFHSIKILWILLKE